MPYKKAATQPPQLEKCPTGISGLDEITGGGLPKGRPTLVTGGPGCGKTVLAMEFLVRGATEFNEPGIFLAFEENEQDLKKNFSSLGFDLKTLEEQKKIAIDYVYIERSQIEETGEYDLEGLFVRLGYGIDSIGAKRVVIDTIEVLFAGLSDAGLLRAELRRLFRWLKDKGVTAVITAERGETTLTRYGLEEYVADCVIMLDHRVTEQLSVRRLRIMKYRGSTHGTNEYPFLIDEQGLAVLPITSLGLKYEVSTERISTGIPRLDGMLGGKGYFKGSTVLASGSAGTGKTSIAAHFASGTCRSGERCLYFAFEESMGQIIRNMRSIGVDLAPWVKKGLLRFHTMRPTFQGLEMHLVEMHKLINGFKPAVVIVDPITNLIAVGTQMDVKSMLTRLIDFLKMQEITTMFTSLTHAESANVEHTDVGISSLMDTWISLWDVVTNGERNRGLSVLKSRGMAHSNQVREFLLTGQGIVLRDIYLGPSGMATGAARVALEAEEKAQEAERAEELKRKKRDLERKRRIMEAQIETLRAGYEGEEEELAKVLEQNGFRKEVVSREREEMARIRQAEGKGGTSRGK
jgi:circadian clock protein KaiC